VGQSIGSMIQGHPRNVKINDLIKNSEETQMMSSSMSSGSDHSSHHSESNRYLKLMHYLTTATIVILLPFILAGTIFMSITAVGRR